METMERQLAGLSSLVHSALVSKGMSESSQRDMQELRRQILALHSDGSGFYKTLITEFPNYFLCNTKQHEILR